MKKYLILAALGILFSACNCRVAQSCSKTCCSSTDTTNTDSTMEITRKPLSCKLTTPEIQERKQTVIKQLKSQVKEKKELGNGYSYRFNGDDATLDLLTGFIKTERLCCDFFNFKLDINNQGFIWLDITGPEGAKEFIMTELEL